MTVRRCRARRGSLSVVGLGINGLPQTTPESAACMRKADRLFYLAIDSTTEFWVRRLNRDAASLKDLYASGKPRVDTYEEMADRILSAVREGLDVCVAFYGHPGVLVNPAQWAMRQARREGYRTRMFPGISAEACLYADLGVNPGDRGVQSFEATDFLLSRRRFDPTSELILWQIGVLGESTTHDGDHPERGARLRMLVNRLRRSYPAGHRVVLYQAASFAAGRAVAKRVPLNRLARARISPLMTLYVPSLVQRPADPRIVGWLNQR